MRAMVLTGFGGPDKLEHRQDWPQPHAGPGEVRLRVGAAGINNTDVWTREGAYGTPGDPAEAAGWRREPLAFPRIQGADVVGRVDEVGAGVSETLLSTRVIVDPVLYAGGERELVITDYLGSDRDGGFADYVTVPAANAHPVDSRLSDAELATFPTAYTTALRMLQRAELRSGEAIVITGASGGVGSALIQLAAARSAHVTAVTKAEGRQRAHDLGAHATVDRESDDLAEQVRVQAGRAPDVVADVVAGPGFPALLRALDSLGRYVVAGAMAGPLVETDLRTIYLKQLRLIGSSFGTHEDFVVLLRHIESGDLEPLLAATYPLSDLNRAQEVFAAKNFFGKLVVTPEDPA